MVCRSDVRSITKLENTNTHTLQVHYFLISPNYATLLLIRWGFLQNILMPAVFHLWALVPFSVWLLLYQFLSVLWGRDVHTVTLYEGTLMGLTFKQTGKQIGLLIVSVDSLMTIEGDGVPWSSNFSCDFDVRKCSLLLIFLLFHAPRCEIENGLHWTWSISSRSYEHVFDALDYI